MSRLITCLAIAVLVGAPSHAQDGWPRFRGPNGQGVNRAASVPVEWSTANYLWRVKLDGNGHGSPVVWDKHVYLMVGDPEGADVTLACYDAITGDKRWERRHEGKKHHLHVLNNYASTTPMVDATGVYVSWADAESYKIAAYSHDGTPMWDHKLGDYESRHGYSRSPIVEDGLVYLACNEQKQSIVVAFNAKTGDEVWKQSRPKGSAAYDTPCIIAAPGGGKAIVSYSNGAGMDALDAKTGKPLWNVPDAFPQRCVSSPVYAGGMLFGASGSGSNGKLLVAIKAPTSQGADPTEVFQLKKAVPYVPTPLVVDDLLLLWHERGTVACFDRTTGDRHWLERIGGKYFASPICAGDVIYNVSMSGEVVALSVNEQGCKVLAKNDLGEPTQATPAVVGTRMWLRTDASLICVGAMETAAASPPTKQETPR